MIKRLLLTCLLATPLLAETLTGTCKRMLDGDTLLLTDGTTVQIWGIDAPEKGQPYADKARACLEKITKGRRGLWMDENPVNSYEFRKLTK